MNLIFQSRHVELTPELQEFVTKQLEELERHQYRLDGVTVTTDRIEKKKNDPGANQVTLLADVPGENVVITYRAVDLKTALTGAVERLDRALRKTKEKRLP